MNKMYTQNDLLRVGKRWQNTKRGYLLINPLQAKHIPVSPTRALEMMEVFGAKVAEQTRVDTVIGFAETATAIGAVVAASQGSGCFYITTTREAPPHGNKAISFKEEHSHAVDASIYMFGIMMSNVHMAWMRVVCGRPKSDYSYSPAVYNNFPWPNPTDAQRVKIEKTAQGILDARSLYPDASLADLYDELTMPSELRTAHQRNDRAVMGLWDESQ